MLTRGSRSNIKQVFGRVQGVTRDGPGFPETGGACDHGLPPGVVATRFLAVNYPRHSLPVLSSDTDLDTCLHRTSNAGLKSMFSFCCYCY